MQARWAAGLGLAIIGLGLVLAGATGARAASEEPTSPAPPPASATADAAWAFAQQLYAEGNFLMAILEAKRLVYLYPTHPAAPEAQYWIGRIYAENLREYDWALSELQRVQQQDPSTRFARLAAALAAQVQGEHPTARLLVIGRPPGLPPERPALLYRRVFAEAEVPRYEILSQAFETGGRRDDFVVLLAMHEDCRERSIRAALDDAIFRSQGRLTQPSQRVAARAYTRGGETRLVGEAAWASGEERAQFAIQPRSALDDLLDILRPR